MQIDDQTVLVTEIEAGHIIRFQHNQFSSIRHRNSEIKQGIVLEAVYFPDDPIVILSLQNDSKSGFYWQYFEPSDKVTIVGFVNASYLDFRKHPEDYTH